MNILEIKKLFKVFDGVCAIDGISVAIEQGKITSIIGPNGSGKTTLINMLSGMLSIDQGTIIIKEKEMHYIPPASVPALGITRTFQEVRLFEQMTVMDNIVVVITERKLSGALFERHGKEHLNQAERALKKVGLWEKRNALAYTISYGERRLLEIARVLAMTENGVDIILFDEPFAGLFKEMIRTIVHIIQDLKVRGKTIILIEHNMDLIRELSDCVIVMDSGRVLAEGSPNEVLARKDVIEAYLGE